MQAALDSFDTVDPAQNDDYWEVQESLHQAYVALEGSGDQQTQAKIRLAQDKLLQVQTAGETTGTAEGQNADNVSVTPIDDSHEEDREDLKESKEYHDYRIAYISDVENFKACNDLNAMAPEMRKMLAQTLSDFSKSSKASRIENESRCASTNASNSKFVPALQGAKFACRTCCNQRRLCIKYFDQGGGELVVVPIPRQLWPAHVFDSTDIRFFIHAGDLSKGGTKPYFESRA
ncbi:hypothetical protein MBLNU230_g6549t1 [Neophaeotheca triangularis]